MFTFVLLLFFTFNATMIYDSILLENKDKEIKELKEEIKRMEVKE